MSNMTPKAINVQDTGHFPPISSQERLGVESPPWQSARKQLLRTKIRDQNDIAERLEGECEILRLEWTLKVAQGRRGKLEKERRQLSEMLKSPVKYQVDEEGFGAMAAPEVRTPKSLESDEVKRLGGLGSSSGSGGKKKKRSREASEEKGKQKAEGSSSSSSSGRKKTKRAPEPAELEPEAEPELSSPPSRSSSVSVECDVDEMGRMRDAILGPICPPSDISDDDDDEVAAPAE